MSDQEFFTCYGDITDSYNCSEGQELEDDFQLGRKLKEIKDKHKKKPEKNTRQ